ncbi:MAG TPA: formyltransferase family protein [Terriglobales bacterium]|nr:formyltransferase family protein [Terriglobales bacterium]
MKTLLICHDGAQLDTVVLARWLNSFSSLVGVVIIQEPRSRLWRRIRREIHRTGILRFLDVLGFRLYYRVFLAAKDREWEQQQVAQASHLHPEIDQNTEILQTPSPNTPQTEAFIRKLNPDMILARCKVILKESIFSIPAIGTFVMHPGICPEYRNAHGCFWALARRDLSKVGMTLLKVDRGIDTGPVFGYYSYSFDEVHESHFVIQSRVVLENLDALRQKLIEIFQGTATPLDTSGRSSNEWGQPRLTNYLRWKSQAKRVRR